MARCDLLGEKPDESDDVLKGRIVRKLLSGQKKNGGFGVHPYTKWTGAHWRLVSLVELQVPPKEPRVLAALETVLIWLLHPSRVNRVNVVDGLVRRCASMEGNALAVASRAGMADDPRTERLAASLIEWQWPDGGWNCDVKATGERSSFHESLIPAWGLHEYATATGDTDAARSARRAAELFLDHRIFRRGGTGDPINKQWMALHYPAYWHYDVLQALVVLARMGLATDQRANDALDHLEARRLEDGRWRPGAYWWKPPGSDRAAEVVNWGRSRPNEMITLNALRVLKAAGRLLP
jgi:hypothetical protein